MPTEWTPVMAAAACLFACTPQRTEVSAGQTSAAKLIPVQEPHPSPSVGQPPTLIEEMRAQGARAARELEKAAGVRLEPITVTSGPIWWSAAVNNPARAAATESAATLPEAFNAAVAKAAAVAESRGSNPRSLRVERASWMRLPTTRYVVWVSLGDGTQSADPLPPIDLPEDAASSATTDPAPSKSLVEPATSAQPDSMAPPWFVATPMSEGGRTTVGVSAEAQTERDAQRAALKAGRTRLVSLIGSEPMDLTTVKTSTVALPDGRFRAYALVSCTGMIP